MTARRRRVLLCSLAAATAAAAGACSEVTTDPNTPVAIAFDSLPAPSIVLNDTLRDPQTGEVIPLSAQAFNSSGALIANAPFVFFARDTGNVLEVAGGTTLIARGRRDSPAGVVASLGALQLVRTIYIVPRPDRLEQAADSVPTITLVVPDNATNVSSRDSLRVRVVHDTTTADSLVRAWIVNFAVTEAAETVADSVWLVNDDGARSAVDTTDASGLASRRVRVFAKPGTATGVRDTVVVEASASYRGAPLGGSPVTFVIPVEAVIVSAPAVGRRAAPTSNDALPGRAVGP